MKKDILYGDIYDDLIKGSEKIMLLNYYINNDMDEFNKLVVKYPEFNHIDLFIKLAKQAYEMFCNNKYCTSMLYEEDFFSLLDCTFRGYNDMLLIDSENYDTSYLYEYIRYDRSCMLYIKVPHDFDEDPTKYKNEFINQAILTIADNYVSVLREDEEGLSGKTIPNPDYIPDEK